MMQLQPNNTYCGFKLIKQQQIVEINSTARLFEHEKSGARLFNLENDDDNKVFSISFRTPPEDSTGVPHIIEHSTLCGSRKFPLKDPFIELEKGSLNTFLNAMTFSDKTMYPVASRNDKDFYNLIDVYMDAVFYPNMYKYPEIFMQEGWHYQLDGRDREMRLNGVVYSEMKGAFSSPESVLYRKIQQSLFPDTPYSFESGGDPDEIPKLSYQEFLNFHKKYYHPSNSYIYLYGNGNILEQLDFLDSKYLKGFDRATVDSKIPLQSGFTGLRDITGEYPVSQDESVDCKTYLSLNFVVGKSTDRELYLAFDVLEHLLLETPASPLREALIDAGIGKDVLGRYDNSILQPVFSIIVKNSDEYKKGRFKEVVFDTLKSLVKDGIDKEMVKASINVKEFELREGDFRGFPRGLLYGIKCMDSWLYDGDPALHLQFEPALEKVKTALNSRYFEELIEKYLLNSGNSTMLVLKPSKGMAETRTAQIKGELSDLKSKMSDEKINSIIEDTERLRKRQSEPDSETDRETIPLLSLKDISRKAEQLPLVEKEKSGTKVLLCPVFTNRIAYLNLFFDTKCVPEDKIPYIGLLAEVIGKIGTEKYDYGKLSNAINIETGGIKARVEVYVDKDDDGKFSPKLTVKSKALAENEPELMELLGEILGHTRFDDKKRLKEIIMETRSRLEMAMLNSGHLVASQRLLSYFSQSGKYTEELGGLEFYKFISDLEKNFDSISDQIINELQYVSDAIFNRQNLLVGVTTDMKDYREFEDNFGALAAELGDKKSKPQRYTFNTTSDNEGLITPGKVQFAAKGYNFKRLGYSYNGGMQVLETIVGLDYLWNNVRVKGGAYGAFINIERNGNIYMSSYRDPNLRETLDVYDEAAGYIRDFDAGDREMTKYIIGTVSKLDYPLTPSMKGDRAVQNYLTHVTQDDIQRERDEVLSVKSADIRAFAGMVRDAMNNGCYCVMGGEGKIKENRSIFGKLVPVFE